MAVKVLVVDDSSFFRRRVSEIINQDPMLTVIDTAQNGREAVDKAMSLRPDVITMDIEMPVMDGISAVREIMAKCPIPILMFSSLTHEGAKATLDALDAGALDFLPKKFEDIARDKDEAVRLLQQRVKEISRKRFLMTSAARPKAPEPVARAPLGSTAPRTPDCQPDLQRTVPSASFKRSGKSYQLVAIGTSTGGPVALQNVLTKLQMPIQSCLSSICQPLLPPRLLPVSTGYARLASRKRKMAMCLNPGMPTLLLVANRCC